MARFSGFNQPRLCGDDVLRLTTRNSAMFAAWFVVML
jgi:hypothetical protein